MTDMFISDISLNNQLIVLKTRCNSVVAEIDFESMVKIPLFKSAISHF